MKTTNRISLLSARRTKLWAILACCLLTATACGNGNTPGQPTAEAVTWSISPATLTLPEQAGSSNVDVSANGEWSVTSDREWCTFMPYMGYPGSTKVKVSAATNYTGSERTATLTFKSGSYTHDYVVAQEGKRDATVEPPAGYVLVWRDEFDGGRGAGGKAALPAAAEWSYETGSSGWGNNELQNYIPAVRGSDTCASVSDGTLKIVAKKSGSEVLSVRMNTRRSWLYGYFEARLRLPAGKGTWPAFWMLPKDFTAWPDDGEVDIMEHVGYRPSWVSSSVHCKAYYHSIGTQKTAETYVATARTDFHVYAVEWTPGCIRGFVDRKQYFEFPNDKRGNKNTWPFNAPFYLKLNLAWGGGWGGAQGVDESALPATYEVDYVRVYQKN
jgi:hypothetical protein